MQLAVPLFLTFSRDSESLPIGTSSSSGGGQENSLIIAEKRKMLCNLLGQRQVEFEEVTNAELRNDSGEIVEGTTAV